MAPLEQAGPPPARRLRETTPPKPIPAERRLNGIAVSPGIAIGRVFGAAEEPAVLVRRKIAAADIASETARLDGAVLQSKKQLIKLRGRLAMLPEDSQDEIAPLLDAYLQMIGPSRLLRDARRRITDTLVNSETAVVDAAEEIAEAVLAVAATDDDPFGRERRAEEVREIARRLVRNLTQARFRSFAALPDGAVLVCEELRPSDAALLDPSRLAGVATDEGGADGHTAIMLRALGVPAVLGVAGLTENVRPGDTVVLDGAAGTVTVGPTAATLAIARRRVTAFAHAQQKLARLRRLPAVTASGEAIELQANLEIPAELPLIAQAGAAGIGLLRSEFLFMNRETIPDEQEQTETYRGVIEAMGGDPVTIRVLDWGGEKEIEALQSEGLVPEFGDRNPALGVRGVRLLLRRTGLFETQLAAILRAATAGPTRILLPMVTTLGELRAARVTYARVINRLRARGDRFPNPAPPLGIMIETPAAALTADVLAREADFFAIGTNDLAMYALAVDRSDNEVSALYDPLHPAVLRLVRQTIQAAAAARTPVSACGEMAGDPRMTRLLLGMGLTSFSMNASSVPRVKQVVRAAEMQECVELATRALNESDPARILAMVLGPAEAAKTA